MSVVPSIFLRVICNYTILSLADVSEDIDNVAMSRLVQSYSFLNTYPLS